MKYSALYLKSPQYVAGSKFWSGGITRSRKRGVRVSEEMAARSHGSPSSPASTSRRPQSAAPPLPLLSPAMNFGLWHISCNKTVHWKCVSGLLSSGTNVTRFPTVLLLQSSRSFDRKDWSSMCIKNNVILISKPVCLQRVFHTVCTVTDWYTFLQSVLRKTHTLPERLYFDRLTHLPTSCILADWLTSLQAVFWQTDSPPYKLYFGRLIHLPTSCILAEWFTSLQAVFWQTDSPP